MTVKVALTHENKDSIVRGIWGLNRMTQIWESANLSWTQFTSRTRRWIIQWFRGGSLEGRGQGEALEGRGRCVDKFSADECHEKTRLIPKDETFLMFLATLVSKEYVGR